ncbi:unnamed protein product [Effrenium voratum]|nr:unnamed protein product [Effrenium voratum]
MASSLQRTLAHHAPHGAGCRDGAGKCARLAAIHVLVPPGRPEPQKEVIRLENELMTSAGPVPRWEPPCGAGRMPLAGHPADAVRRTADAATEAGRMPLTGHWADDARTADAATEAGLERRTADAATEITPREEKLIASRMFRNGAL